MKNTNLTDSEIITAIKKAGELSIHEIFNQLSFYRSRPLRYLLMHWLTLSNGEPDFKFQGWEFQEIGHNLEPSVRFLVDGKGNHCKIGHVLSWVKANLDSTAQDWIDDYDKYAAQYAEQLTENMDKLIREIQALENSFNESLMNQILTNELIVNIMNSKSEYISLISKVERLIYRNTSPYMAVKTNCAYVKHDVFDSSKQEVIAEPNSLIMLRFIGAYDYGFYIDREERGNPVLFDIKDLFTGKAKYLKSL